jgi:hypothetical protein
MEGEALLAIWHDVDAEAVEDYLRWHSFEHLPERLALLGFKRARRYERQAGAGQRFLSIVEAERLEDFKAKGYLDRLNAPSDWTRRLMPRYSNVHRAVCQTILDVGGGQAPLACCIRFNPRAAAAASLPPRLLETIEAQREVMNLAHVQIGLVDNAVSDQKSQERTLRHDESAGGFAYVLMMTAVESRSLAAARSAVIDALASFSEDATATNYGFSFALP